MSDKTNVLIIEDSYIIRLEVKQVLELYGLKVSELDNAEELFRFPKRYHDFSLLILDISLPGMDGLTALEKMRSYPEWANLPVIMLTGRADLRTVQRALRAGAVNYIRKPFTGEELLERVFRSLDFDKIHGSEEVWPGEELFNQIRNEISRAERGKSKFSLVGIKVADPIHSLKNTKDFSDLMLDVKKELSEIDTIFYTRKHNLLLVLPFMDNLEALTFAGRIQRQFTPQINPESPPAVVTFPDDDVNEQMLLYKLEKRLERTRKE